MMSMIRAVVHGLVVAGMYGFAILGPGFVGSVLEEAERMARRSRFAADAPDFATAEYVLFACHLLCLAGAWQVSRMSNRWRLRA